MAIKSVEALSTLPHSWTLATWPQHVAPQNGVKAGRIIRQNKDALFKAGALTRIGREFYIFGKEWEKWLRLQGNRVFDYEIAPNKSQHAHKRRGAHRKLDA